MILLLHMMYVIVFYVRIFEQFYQYLYLKEVIPCMVLVNIAVTSWTVKLFLKGFNSLLTCIMIGQITCIRVVINTIWWCQSNMERRTLPDHVTRVQYRYKKGVSWTKLRTVFVSAPNMIIPLDTKYHKLSIKCFFLVTICIFIFLERKVQ